MSRSACSLECQRRSGFSYLGLIMVLLALHGSAGLAQPAQEVPWAARSRHACVVYEDALWVIGGATWGGGSYDDPEDMWYSTDGYTWTLAIDEAYGMPRHDHAVEAFGGAMWVLGGLRFSQPRNDVWFSDGTTMTRVLGEREWSQRNGHASVIFEDRMWILGGRHEESDAQARDYDVPLNDVWNSADGQDWGLVTDSAPWPGRWQHSTVVHDGRIWVLGGWDLSTEGYRGMFPGDIWSSSDGVTWTRVAADVACLRRATHGCVVYDGRIWVIGGYGDQLRPVNDVWSSADGVTWTQATDGAPWRERYELAACVFDGEIYVVGGRDDDLDLNDVWRSSDGANWTQAGLGDPTPTPEPTVPPSADPSVWAERSGHASVIHDGKMWILGGTKLVARNEWGGSINTDFNDVWSSETGAEWTRVTEAAAWTPRWGHSSFVFDDKIWVARGSSHERHDLTTDLWCSDDGVSWAPVAVSAAWPRQWGDAMVVFDDKIWLLGGSAWVPSRGTGSGELLMSDVWCSDDGVTWQQVTEQAPWPGRAAHRVLVHDGRMWVMGGWDGFWDDDSPGVLADVWSSPDGENWTQATPEAPWVDTAYYPAVAAFNGRMWLVGGYDLATLDGNPGDVWSSTDGQTWEHQLADARWRPLGGHTAVVLDDMIYLIAGADYHKNLNEVWRSPNGVDWEQIFPPTPAPPSSRFGRIWRDGGRNWVIP